MRTAGYVESPGCADETRRAERVGGVRWTIRGGVVFDAMALLADVERMVKDARDAHEAEAHT